MDPDRVTQADHAFPQPPTGIQSVLINPESGGVPEQGQRSLLDSPEFPWVSDHIQNRVSAFRCRLFWEHVVLPHEALAFVFFFFEKLYPFFPLVPDMYYICATSNEPDLQTMQTLFEGDEILLASIITVSSRYYHLPSHAIGGYERSCEIHSRCWDWTRLQISKVVFEGSRPKALLSVVESLLMLAEWMPKSIHALVENANLRDGAQWTTSRYSISEQILQPAFRTDHVSWYINLSTHSFTFSPFPSRSYVGNAFLLLRSLPPDNRVCPVLQTPNRYLVTLFSCLIMSQSLARRLARPPLMTFDDVDMTQISLAFTERNTRLARALMSPPMNKELSWGTSDSFHEAFVELMRLLTRTQEVLHPPTADCVAETRQAQSTTTQLVTLLQHFDNLNKSWRTRYSELLGSK